MSNPTPAAIAAEYRDQLTAMSTNDLLAIVRGTAFDKSCPKYLRTALANLANDICQARGVTLPLFASFFAS